MKIWPGMLWIFVGALATVSGCVEDPSVATPNSDRGHLFVDLEAPLAVDWESEIVVLGPATGGQYCSDEHGCYSDHLPVQMDDIVSSDPSVIEVTGFHTESFGEVETIRVQLRAVGAGEARLEFLFDIDGYEPEPPPEDSSPPEAAPQGLEVEANAEEGADDEQNRDEQNQQEGETLAEEEIDEAESQQAGLLRDSFGIEARDVASVRLSRILDDVDASGPYGQCPLSGPGTYLIDHLEDYAVQLKLEKVDSRGELLRGSGEFPFEIEPEDAVEVEMVDEARHLVSLRPQSHGAVKFTPKRNGVPFEAYFTGLGDVTTMDVAMYLLNEHGTRAGEVTAMVVNYLYELNAGPQLPHDAPLCGGGMDWTVQSLTPAVCDVVGVVQDSGNPALLSEHGGECLLRITLEGATGGQGLVEDYRFPVHYDW